MVPTSLGRKKRAGTHTFGRLIRQRRRELAFTNNQQSLRKLTATSDLPPESLPNCIYEDSAAALPPKSQPLSRKIINVVSGLLCLMGAAIAVYFMIRIFIIGNAFID